MNMGQTNKVKNGHAPEKHDGIKYPRSAYTFPTQARVEKVTFDESYMHLHLRDGQIVSVPLKWIPTLANAAPAEREKVFIGNDGHTLHWNPDEGEINEDLRVDSLMRYDTLEL
jgi:hypothetical protein